MKSRKSFPASLLALVLWLLTTAACTHFQNQSSSQVPTYRFPPTFYVEQELLVETPEGTQHMVAQLNKQGPALDLVLTDSMTSLVLTRVSLTFGKSPKVSYLAPVLLDKKFPGEEISLAIQYLYAQEEVPLDKGHYTVADPDRRWVYNWDSLRGEAGCLFPEIIHLSFNDRAYKIKISLKELDCTVQGQP